MRTLQLATEHQDWVCACLKEAIIAKKKGGAIDAKVENAVMT